MTRTTVKLPSLLTQLVLGAILLVAFIVRVVNLTQVPAGFFADEAAVGYNAYSLLKTGADEYGIPFPFFFRSFGDWRNPVPIYLNIPTIALFGLNEFAVRLTAALAGTLTVLLVFLLVQAGSPWRQGRTTDLFAFLTSWFLAIMPWHIHFSRFGSEYIYFPLLLSLGWVLFVWAQKTTGVLPLSFLVFGVTLYTYYPTWLVTPAFVLLLVILYHQWLRRHGKMALLSLVLFVLSTLPLVWGINQGVALTRWRHVAITQEKNVPLPLLFAKNYLSHFSPGFLFTKGDIDYPGHFIRRFSSRGAGQLYAFWAPLVIVGLLTILLKPTRFLLAVFGLMLLYPLGSTFANTDGGAPLAFRSIIGVLPFPIMAALGAVALIKLFQSRLIRIVLLGLLLTLSVSSLARYLVEYHTQYPRYSSDFWGWQFGPREVMAYFLAHRDEYDEMYLMGNFNAPGIFIKFYDPGNRCQGKCAIGGMEKLDPDQRQLFAVGADRMSEISRHTFQTQHIIFFPNGSSAFFLGTFR